MSSAVRGEYLHFRCPWHAVEGHFQMRSGFEAKCEVITCKNRGHGYWYRGEKFAKLPQPVKATNEDG